MHDEHADRPGTADLAAAGPDQASDRDAPVAREAEETEQRDRRSAPATDGGEATTPLFNTEETERFRSRWTEIQTGFVDRPRDVVADADSLVAEVMQRLAAQFSETRSKLEAQWDQTDDVSTEDLRVALTRYRSFFERLLAA